MTTMLEKMAQAIWTQLPQDDANMATSNRIARAALQAIREPREAMSAGPLWQILCDWRCDGDFTPGEEASRVFTAMIDAILSQSQEGNHP